MDDRSLQVTEAWFRLLSEAARGTRAAKSTIRRLADSRLAPERLMRSVARMLPAGVPAPSAETVAQWTDDLWRAAGVVPRARYDELLERYELLRARLEEAEVSIGRLKRMLSEHGRERDAEKLLDVWANAVGETLRAQAEWMRRWMPAVDGEPGDRAPAALPVSPEPASPRPKRTAPARRKAAAAAPRRPRRKRGSAR